MMDIQLNSPAAMAAHLLQGFAWGLAVRQSGDRVENTGQLPRLEKEVLSPDIQQAFISLFSSESEPEALIARLDKLVDRYSGFEDLREFLFDLLVLKFIMDADEESDEEDFLESEEWASIEEQAEDRGTELLNVLVYLKDCQENLVKPSMEDFLHMFLLVDEDDYQDEFLIYEPMVKNQDLPDGTIEDILKIGAGIRQEEMQDIFIPVVLFFKTQGLGTEEVFIAILNDSPQPDIHSGVFNLLIKFNALLRMGTSVNGAPGNQ